MVHGKPVATDFFREIAITQGGFLEPIAERLRAVRGRVILDCSVDVSTAIAGPCRLNHRLCGFVLQNDIDAFSHGWG